MNPPQDDRAVDPELLAKLVLECRQFRTRLIEVGPQVPRRKDAPFLFRQLEEETEFLEEALQGLGLGPTERAKRPAHKDGPGFFARLFGRAKDSHREALDMLGGLDLQGRAWTIPVSEVIGFLSTSGKTGILSVHATTENFLIELHKGRLVHAKSDQTPEGMRLGEILCRAGALQASEVGSFIEEAREEDLPLGAYLLKAEHLTEKGLHDALAVQVQSMFHRLFTAENAIYRFREGARIEQVQDLGLNITQLLLESARFHDEAGFQTEDAIESLVDTALVELEAQAAEAEEHGSEGAERDQDAADADEPAAEDGGEERPAA